MPQLHEVMPCWKQERHDFYIDFFSLTFTFEKAFPGLRTRSEAALKAQTGVSTSKNHKK
ncbi:MAG TPA: hypothetical protein PKZ19_12230 [Zoogloea sp.]|nr:hypothetical protein [Zoogloea sp.]HQZ02856.1 hypothetical protein [Thauera sp.]